MKKIQLVNSARSVVTIFAILAFSLSAYSFRAEKTYKIDSAKSHFIVKVGASGLFSSLGHNHTIKIMNFNGEAKINSDALDQSSLTMTVETGSSRVIDTEISESDRKEVQSTMLDKVLEVGQFPAATFKSTKVVGVQRNGNDAKLTLEGDLNLHGVQHHISIPMTVTVSGNELRARGEFGLKQTEYKIQPVSAGLGSVKVKDEVRISFDILAF